MLRWVLVVFACINVGLPIANARAESSATDSVMQYLTTYGVFHNGNYYQESNFGYGHVGWTEFRGKLKNSISYDDTKPGPDPDHPDQTRTYRSIGADLYWDYARVFSFSTQKWQPWNYYNRARQSVAIFIDTQTNQPTKHKSICLSLPHDPMPS